jgi:hypothetical protein
MPASAGLCSRYGGGVFDEIELADEARRWGMLDQDFQSDEAGVSRIRQSEVSILVEMRLLSF